MSGTELVIMTMTGYHQLDRGPHHGNKDITL